MVEDPQKKHLLDFIELDGGGPMPATLRRTLHDKLTTGELRELLLWMPDGVEGTS